MFFFLLFIFDCFLLVVWVRTNKVKRSLVKKHFFIASFGLFVLALSHLHTLSIGCPLFIECYLPGWEVNDYIGHILLAWFFTLLPLSIYKIISIFRF